MTRKKSTALLIPEKPIITLTDEQFRRLEEIEQASKRPNPLPWAMVGLALILIAIVGGMGLVVAILKPTPIVYQITPNTVMVKTDTPQPTATKTYTLTPTWDATKTMEASPAWQTIRDYLHFVSVADFGSAWGSLTTRCKNTMCWDRWDGDYLAFQEWWRNWGKMEIRRLTPELLTGFDGQAFVVLYFYKDELTHDYRFYLRKIDGKWKINSVEYVAPMR